MAAVVGRWHPCDGALAPLRRLLRLQVMLPTAIHMRRWHIVLHTSKYIHIHTTVVVTETARAIKTPPSLQASSFSRTCITCCRGRVGELFIDREHYR
jgi:hypothetical protein